MIFYSSKSVKIQMRVKSNARMVVSETRRTQDVGSVQVGTYQIVGQIVEETLLENMKYEVHH